MSLTVLQIPATGTESSFKSFGLGLQDPPCPESRKQGRTDLVGQPDDKVEWAHSVDDRA